MSRHRLILALAGALAILASQPAAAATRVEQPSAKVLYQDGPNGRFLLGGTWLYLADPFDVGVDHRIYLRRGTGGWRRVRVPNAFNAGDYSQQSFDGSVGWYRKDFRAPTLGGAVRWAFRFESVNYRARVWLNGQPLGSHVGAYLPFELVARAIKPHGVNRLVVRVDSRRLATDVPPRLALWWNWGGILREVYLRRVARLDMEDVAVTPALRDGNRRATVTVAVTVRNRSASPRGGMRGMVLGPGLGRGVRVRFARGRVAARSTRSYLARVTLRRPSLWWPERPSLYRLRLEAGPRARPDQTYSTDFGVRTFARDGSGHVLLNGRRIQLRGAGMHEDSLTRGAALTVGQRAASIRYLKELGANFTRAHYPLHPETLEACDREGIIVWDEIPFYQLSRAAVDEEGVREEGLAQLRQMIERDRNHASVMAYSIGNELGEPYPALEDYIRRAARLARVLDPSRLLALDIGVGGILPPNSVYGLLDAIGINEYFGWYQSTLARLGPTLDALRRIYPAQALFVTEFGAEANRHGPDTEKGTYEFQARYLRDQLRDLTSKPYINGVQVWALREFAVMPGWSGGNPVPDPPFHTKGLVTLRGGLKPAFGEVARLYRQTPAVR